MAEWLGIVAAFVGFAAFLFVIVTAIAYIVVRLVFIRIAERISERLAAGLSSLPTDGIAAASSTAASAAGRRISALALERGLNLQAARTEFFGSLERLARLMDRAVPVPLVGGVGLDALLGFIPFVGDAVSAFVAAAIVLRSLEFGIPRELVAKMVANIFVDMLFGAVPLLGDIFDIAFKANSRNVSLLREHLERRQLAV